MVKCDRCTRLVDSVKVVQGLRGLLLVCSWCLTNKRKVQKCPCKPGVMRDNCAACEGTGWVLDFARIRREVQARVNAEVPHANN
jgi:hypothetical protein